jgi:hypothetical protein
MKYWSRTSASEKELGDLLRVARHDGVFLVGPFRRRNGSFVFGCAETVITDTELRELQKDRKLSFAHVQEFTDEKTAADRNRKR